jgi:hypothetical protein
MYVIQEFFASTQTDACAGRHFDGSTMPRLISSIAVFLLLPSSMLAQGGYYISQRLTLPPLTTFGPVTDVSIGVNREDVKAIGMGRAQVAKGNTFMALTYNPALLAHESFSLEVPSIQASLPTQTYDAMIFLRDNMQEFQRALFLTQVQEGIDDFKAATTDPQKLASLRKIEAGLKFPRDLLTDVIGTSDNPTTHGVLVIPAVVAQVGHWGFSVHANLQTGFQVIQSPTFEALTRIDIPDNLQDPAAVARAVTQLAGVMKNITRPDGSFYLDEALPQAFAVSYIDIVGSVGYGMPVTPDLSIGGSLKIINRRFSTKRLASDTFDDILSEVRKDFISSVTGISADLGGLYHVRKWGTDVGLSIENILPFKGIRSSMNASFSGTTLDYARTPGGQFILSPAGDTAIISYDRKVTIDLPYELKLPVILNVGACQPLTPQWDVALDIVDVAQQDVRYERYLERLRIGTEYRLEAIDHVLGVTPRIGLANLQVTVGLGLNIFRVLQIDAAYAHDTYVNAWSYFLQARLGW